MEGLVREGGKEFGEGTYCEGECDCDGLLVLLEEDLELTELDQQRLMHQVLDVLDVIVGLVLALLLFAGVARVDTLEDA